jgi:hypothetical protein
MTATSGEGVEVKRVCGAMKVVVAMAAGRAE